MYTTTRQDAAEKLGMSTRSIDRYVKAGKLRSKKEGKIIYIHTQDVENLSGENSDGKPEIIVPKEKSQSYTQQSTASHSDYREKQDSEPQQKNTSIMDAQSRATLEKIYLDLRSEIKSKDQTLQDLAMRLGQAQEIAKNSVSMIEFKKSQYLLEESKGHLNNEVEILKNKTEELVTKLKYEKSTNYMLIAFCIILLVGLSILWFLKI